MLKLGTERHHSLLLKGIDSLKDIGCFALTELGTPLHKGCHEKQQVE